MKKKLKHRKALQSLSLAFFLLACFISLISLMGVASAWDAGIDSLPLSEGAVRILASMSTLIISGIGARCVIARRYNEDQKARKRKARDGKMAHSTRKPLEITCLDGRSKKKKKSSDD